ncbi:FERM and PDZ domain-containing protein 2 isoform X1 [Gasterosteus aculeatus]|uniref:FERM and PDZ domain containing 2 n=2 Tax=Gasterosteus aculeatus TaxID=69293 RepID=A0AAQ4NZV5_GASAC|nr:tyrosine-protein phosphatase non-receptor type 13 isoform X1 [Gasterosteus aculeatus aculeatus]XP_040033289.1 tyrosine-protein phosphatase non-receptor type 13 isoform X1 [Gasterosteus aculeatus aculeatus]XP_040033290.1 tyrosine-protein phosphatase non-receptor type 13 isoform X1 [Gasterosteus aculeatus aculeatus]XP_040033291.1 tyrosine-protein phosphatase non-receptor type 13 isoform X1 [Gasterosteus aculeatus aculeatus]XP_040033292.1 tyrosine-protein phosphatase non-receptor type 13 isofor
MGTFVTLAEVLEGRGSKLDEDEVWCLLLATTEALLAVSKKGSGNMCSVLSPGSVLLSGNGSLAFKSCARYEDVASFTAPEIQQGQAASTRTSAEKMVVYSLGMTLYWCVDYHLPQNQPVQMSAELEGLLLSMCEDMVVRRTDLLTVLETCELHHRASMLPPADRLIRQLVEDVYRNSVDHVSMAENGSRLTDRSQLIRDRLHRGSFSNSTWELNKKISRTFSGASYSYGPSGIPPGGQHRESYGSWQQLNRSPRTPYVEGNRKAISRSLAQFESTMSFNDKKAKDMGPEFIRTLEEPLVVLELPGSILSKKGKSPTTQRELSVVMPNGQSILVKCEVKSSAGDIFDMIVAHSNLVEHFYFALAYIDDNEFFFLDNDTKISKVAPDSWKKVPTTTFVLFLRIKFFVNDICLLHKQTCHQYYLQLRRDLLEDQLSCHEETALYLGALALQSECGDCMPEVYGKNYYRPNQYVSKSVMEKRALPLIQAELLRLHANNAQMLTDESELEFLKVCQQLPEYGVLFHRVIREKRPSEGEIMLGVCAKGVIVFEVKDGCRSTNQTFYWREAATISSNRRKFVVESRVSKKKHIFITESSKIAQYLCNLCSAQHKFNNEMISRQLSHSLVSEDNIVQYAAGCCAHSSQHKSFSCSETPQDDSGLTTPQGGSLNKLCDDVTARIEARLKQQLLNEQSQRSSTGMRSPVCSQKSGSKAHSGSPPFRETPATQRASSEREVLCVNLKKDPHLGLGVVIVGEDTVGHYDLGIFVASIVPGGPADKDGRIQPGGRLISLNHISLEGVTFSKAAEVMQSSPEEVQLIISQPKVGLSPNNVRSPVMRHYESQTTVMTDVRSAHNSLDEIVSAMMTPKTANRLNVPREVRDLGAQDSCSLSAPLHCVEPEEIPVQIRKISGSLGISISGGVNNNLPNGGIFIRSLVPGGAAERDGRVCSGDRLLEVDGISVQCFTYRQAVDCLSKTGELVTLVVERVPIHPLRVSFGSETIRSASNPSINPERINSCSSISAPPPVISDRPKDYVFVTDENTQEVTLAKSDNSLGFSFLMCELDPPTRDFGSLVRIKELFPGQPALQSGKIQEGDVLLAINGQSLKELSYSKVLKLFKNAPAEVRLTLSRPAPGILPSIDQFTDT